MHRIRPELALAGTLAVSAAGCVVLAVAGAGLVAVIVGASAVNAMSSAIVALSTDLIVGAAPPERAGAASSVSETSFKLGIAFGVALLGAAGAVAFRNTLAIPAGVSDSAIDTLGSALNVARAQPDGGAALADAARAAFLSGMHAAAWIGAAITAAAAVAALALWRRPPSASVAIPHDATSTHADTPDAPVPGHSAVMGDER